MIARAALLALGLIATAPIARAGEDELLGRWRFATAPHPASGCTISGLAVFSPGVAPSLYAISLEAEEHCPELGRMARVSERCLGMLMGEELRIRCRLIQSDVRDYVPDHFRLDALSQGLMSGRLDDERAWDVPVRFEREGADALIS